MTTLLTSEQRVKLINNGELQRTVERLEADPVLRFDPFPIVKLFTPDANATWLLVELDPGDADLAFGLWGAPHNPNYVDPSVMWTPTIRSSPFAATRTGSLHITTALACWRASPAGGPTRP